MEASLDATTSVTQYVTNYALHSTLRVLRLATAVFAVALLLVIAILLLIQSLGGVTSIELTNALNAANQVRDLSNGFNVRANIILFALSVLGLLTYAYRTAKTVGQQSVLRMFRLDIQQSRTELDEMLEFFMGKTVLDTIRYLSQYIIIITLLLLIPATLGIFAPSIGQSVDYKEIELKSQMAIAKSSELNQILVKKVQLLPTSKQNLTPADEENILIIVNAYYTVLAHHYKLPLDPNLLRVMHERLVRFLVRRGTAPYMYPAEYDMQNNSNGALQQHNNLVNILGTGDLGLELAEIEKRSPGFLEKLKLSLSKISLPGIPNPIGGFFVNQFGRLLKTLNANKSANHLLAGTFENVTTNNPALSLHIVNQQNAFLLAALQGHTFSEAVYQAFGDLDDQFEMLNKTHLKE
ncbi:MAG: hypothetical protein GC179_14000 [Anaerolineaceae bacterium]|nr:hypothetical protein [Anaerolineaceae bacterium]